MSGVVLFGGATRGGPISTGPKPMRSAESDDVPFMRLSRRDPGGKRDFVDGLPPCPISPSCFTCPLPACIYDESRMKVRGRIEMAKRIAARFQVGGTRDSFALMVSVSPRTVSRDGEVYRWVLSCRHAGEDRSVNLIERIVSQCCSSVAR